MENQSMNPAACALPEILLRYGSILSRERPAHEGDLFSRRHPRMPRQHRAKIFAPFAALEGFDDCVRSKEIPYVPRHVPDADELCALNQALSALSQMTRSGPLARRNNVAARVTYFALCTDENHEACGVKGLYHTLTDVVQNVDPVTQTLRIGGVNIPFSDIDSITDPAGVAFRQDPHRRSGHE